MTTPAKFYQVNSVEIPAWGYISSVLVAGWDNHRVNGTPYLWRVGPFMPPMTVYGTSIMVTEVLRRKMEGRFSDLRFVPVVKERIVHANWHLWDRQRLPKLMPPGDPENFILERVHSPEAADELGDVSELWLKSIGHFVTEEISSDGYSGRRIDLTQWAGQELFFVEWNRRLRFLVTESAKQWLEENCKEWLQFREIPSVRRREDVCDFTVSALRNPLAQYLPLSGTKMTDEECFEECDDLSPKDGCERFNVLDWSLLSETIRGEEITRDIWFATQLRTIRVWQSRRGDDFGPLFIDLYNERSDECEMKTAPVARVEAAIKLPKSGWCECIAIFALWGATPENFAQEVAEFARDVKSRFDEWWATKVPPRKPRTTEGPFGPNDPFMRVIRAGEAEFEKIIERHRHEDRGDGWSQELR